MDQQTKDEIAGIAERLSAIKDAEDEKLSNLEEKFSETAQYQEIEEIIDKLDDAIMALEGID